MKILAGIVTYNPDLNRLKENVEAIIWQVDYLIVVDNGSNNLLEITQMISQRENIRMISLGSNKGIAFALKQIMDYAIYNSFDWVLTLDQDSVVIGNLVKQYTKYIGPTVGALTCNVKDRNFSQGEQYTESLTEIDTCLTSACFMSVDAYKHTNGYDPAMFIDCVDFDICYSLKDAGYRIYKIPYLGLLHEIGKAKDITFLGRKTQTFNHPAWRRYYANRNMIYLARKHPKDLSMSKAMGRCVYRTIVTLIYEDDKWGKFTANFKGTIDGYKMRISNR